MQCVFLVPRDLPGPSGGTHYNSAVVDALRAAGHSVTVRAVPGGWPRGSVHDRAEASRMMSVGRLVVVDGIVALAAPEAVRMAVATGTRVHILLHSLLTAEPDLSRDERRRVGAQEREALHFATSTSCASRWSARDVAARHPGVTPHVLVPGTHPAEVAQGSTPPQFLALAALTPVKNQLTLLRALGVMEALPWSLQVVGSESIHPEYAASLRSRVRTHLPAGRVTFRGPLAGDDLDAVWSATDLLLLTSTSETFGMVVTEALARGIPAVVPAATGAVEALLGPDEPANPPLDPPGAIVDPRDATVMAATLESWLTDPASRTRWRTSALSRRPRLRGWSETAAELVGILQP